MLVGADIVIARNGAFVRARNPLILKPLPLQKNLYRCEVCFVLRDYEDSNPRLSDSTLRSHKHCDQSEVTVCLGHWLNSWQHANVQNINLNIDHVCKEVKFVPAGSIKRLSWLITIPKASGPTAKGARKMHMDVPTPVAIHTNASLPWGTSSKTSGRKCMHRAAVALVYTSH